MAPQGRIEYFDMLLKAIPPPILRYAYLGLTGVGAAQRMPCATAGRSALAGRGQAVLWRPDSRL